MIVKKNLDIFLRLLGKKEKLLFQYVVFLQLGGSILEAFGIALIIPILGIILGQDGSNFFFLRDINESLNISNKGSLLMFLVATMLLFFIFKNAVFSFYIQKNLQFCLQYPI